MGKDDKSKRGGRNDRSESDSSGSDIRSSGDDGDRERGDSLRDRLEAMVPEVVKRAMITGLGALFVTEETVRSAVSDMPKEAVSFFVGQAAETKEQLLGLVAKEVREYLASSDLSDELAKVLTKLSLDVRTEIRFIPNEEASDGIKVKPDATYEVGVRREE